MKSKRSLHGFLLVLHRITGLSIAIFLIMVGLTGAILAFGVQIDRLLNPQLHAKIRVGQAPLDLATFAERVETAYPHLRAAYYSVEKDQVVMIVGPRIDPATGKPYLADFEQLILDPWTGDILGKGVMEGSWRGPESWRLRFLPFIYGLHTSLATGTSTGWTIVGIVALIWTIDSFVGFYLTFPRGKQRFWQRWSQAWKIKLGASSTRVNFDIHRAGGLWLWPLLFVFGWSSVMLGLRAVYEPVTHALFDYKGEDDAIGGQSLAKPLENPRLDWREAQTAGERAMAKQAALHHFTVERPYGMAYIAQFGAYTYCVKSDIDFRGSGWDTSVLIDGNTGALREVDLARGQHLGNTISTLLWGIHYGDLRDWLSYRILIGFFGVFLAVLSYTGVVIWWRKRKVRRTAVRTKLPAAVTFLLLCFATSAVRAQSTPVHLTNDQVAKIRKIEGRLMAPCCYTQTIRDHDSQVAEEIREEVTAMVSSAKSEQEVITYYRKKYGETILVVPDGMSGSPLTFAPLLTILGLNGSQD